MSVLLKSQNESLSITTSSTSEISYSFTYNVTGNQTFSSSSEGLIITATNTTVVDAPSLNYYYDIVNAFIVNNGLVANIVQVNKIINGILYPQFATAISLLAGEYLQYNSNEGWRRYDSEGQFMTVGEPGPPGTAGTIVVGTTSMTLGDLNFINSNNITWGLSSNSLTASFAGGGGGAITISAGTSSRTLNNIVYSDSHGISFGLNGSTITGSHNGITSQSLQPAIGLNTALTANGVSWTVNSSGLSLNVPAFLTTAQPVGAYLTTAMESNANTSFVGLNSALTANGVSATINSSGISLNVPAFLTTAQPIGAYLTTAMVSNAITISNINVSGGTTSRNLSNIVFSNENNVSFGLVGSSITGSASFSQSIQPTFTVSAGAQTATSGSLVFLNASGVEFGLNAGTITASVKTDYQTSGNYLTTAMVSNANTSFVGLNSALTANGVSASINSSGISLNFPAFLTTAQPIGAYLTTAMLSNGGSNFIGLNSALTANGVSASINSSGISFNFPAFLTTAMQSASSSVFAKTGFSSTTTNGTDIKGTNNTNGLSIAVPNYLTTAQPIGAYLTTAMESNANTSFVGLNSALTANGVSATINSSGISLNVPAFLTTAMASNASTNFAGIGSAITNGIMTFGTGGLSLNLSNLLTTAALSSQTLAFSLSGNISTTNSSQILNGGYALAGGNGVTLQQSNNTVSISVATNYQSQGAYLTTAMASNAGSNFVGLNSALTANGVSATINSSGISLNIPAFLTTAQPVGAYLTTARASTDAIGLNTALTANGVSWTVNSSGLSLNVPAFLTTAMASNAATISNIKVSAGTTSNNLSAITFDNAGGVSFGLNGSVLTAVAPTGVASPVNFSAGTASNNLASVVFANGNGVSFGLGTGASSQSITASHNGITTARASSDGIGLNTAGSNMTWTANSSGLSIDARGYAGTGTSATNASITLNSNGLAISIPNSFLLSRLFALPFGQFSSSQQTNSQMSFRYMSLEAPMSFSRVDIPMNVSLASSAIANTGNIVFTSGMAIYSLNGSTLNPIVGNTANTTYTWASNSANYSSIIGGRYASFPLATSLSAGEYWLGAFLSTNNNSSIGTATTQLANTISVFCGAFITAQNFAEFGLTTGVSSIGLFPLQGCASLSISNTTMTFQQSQITASGTAAMRGNIMLVFRNL